MHPDTGRRYQWANDLPIADAPGWLVDACRKPTEAAVRPVVPLHRHGGDDLLIGLVRVVLEAPPGERNNRLNWSAYTGGQHVAAGRIAAAELRAALATAATEVGLPLHEVKRTIRSGMDAALCRAR